MENKKMYPGLDVLKFCMALLVAQRHIIQIFFQESSRWRVIIGSWLSNLPVPVFFTIAGFFLFRKLDEKQPDHGIVKRYAGRIFRLYLIWSLIYLPIDIFNWSNEPDHSVWTGIPRYLHHFLFDSTIPQLWYLPALGIACLIVWTAYTRGVKIRYLLGIGLILFAAGCIGNNWMFNQQLPMKIQKLLEIYSRYFLTLRNGIFYGIFFLALGLALAKTTWRPPFVVSVAGVLLSLVASYWEASSFCEVNFVFTTAPAAYFLFTTAESLRLPDWKLFPRLRGMSEWIYFSHFYFFHFLVWTRSWNPVPFSSKSITVMIMTAVLVFSWLMVRLSETRGGRWLRYLI
jgi:serine/alanine racemase